MPVVKIGKPRVSRGAKAAGLSRRSGTERRDGRGSFSAMVKKRSSFMTPRRSRTTGWTWKKAILQPGLRLAA